MKRVVIGLWLAILLLLSVSGPVFAADALVRMLRGDVEYQDALIVGRLIDKQEDKFSVRVLKVISGKASSDIIYVASDFYYGWVETELPAVNDFCVMSLKRSQGVYRKAWGIFKADSGDYRTLRLVPENARSTGLSGDLACIEWFVNSGGTENDFFFDRGTAHIRRPNGETVQIYPKPTTDNNTKLPGLTQNRETTATVAVIDEVNLSLEPLINIPAREVYLAFIFIGMLYFVLANKMKPHVMSETGEVVLQYDLAHKVFTMVYFTGLLVLLLPGFINWIYAAYYYTYVNPRPNYTVVPTVLAIVFFGGIWGAAFFSAFTVLFRTTHTITKEGIIRQRRSTKTQVKWSDIEQVRIKGGGLFIFRTPEAKIVFSLNLQSSKIIAQAIKDHLTVDMWKQDENVIDGILAR